MAMGDERLKFEGTDHGNHLKKGWKRLLCGLKVPITGDGEISRKRKVE